MAHQLPATPAVQITVFGSAALQVLLSGDFLSADVDLFATADLREFVQTHQLGEGQSELAIHVCDPIAFRTALDWPQRAVRVDRQGHTFIFPHPYDILVSKLPRLEAKDSESFQLVLRLTGHPTEEELIHHLQLAVDLYRPSFDEEKGGDLVNNTRALWQLLYGKSVDVRRAIITPALERRRLEYAQGSENDKKKLGTLRKE